MKSDPASAEQLEAAPNTILLAIPAGPSNDAEIEFSEILGVIWRSRLLVISAVVTCTIAAILLSFLVTRTYAASTLLSPVQSEQGGALASLSGQLQGIASLAGASAPLQKNAEEAIATLKSRKFIEAFIEEQMMLPRLFAEKWDGSANAWGEDHREEPPTAYEGYQHFLANILSVSSSADTGLVTLSIEWHEPAEARDWANGLVTRVNERLRADAITEAQESLKYLNQELGKTQVIELRQGIYRLIETQINTIMLADVREDFAFKVIDPAVAPNQRDKVRPKRILFALAGLLIGCLAAFAMILWKQAGQIMRPADAVGVNE